MTARTQRTVISIFLFLSLTAPFVGTYTWLQYEKYQTKKAIKWRMIAGMSCDELVLLKFSKNEAETKLEWEHSREFEYDRQMYDVVEAVTKGDSVYYWCWWDNEETLLNRRLEQLVAQIGGEDTENQESETRLANFMKELYHDDYVSVKEMMASRINIPSYFSAAHYCSISNTPLAPPPERV